ncbi:hypothetical protein QBC47DRAFT_440076 [Echria macrotheca]|uniref:Uncharacterized protein n=1 Tax=Echria macrotheca TaxID=438768 RepID=A0AAJ0B132_9PEZI|nr:hypothetical protein QBC47DRAFT_440076 [Echria macrotheca]
MLVSSTITGAIAGLALLAGHVAALPATDGSAQAIPEKRSRSWEIDMQDVCHTELGDEWTALKKGDHCDQWACLNQGTRAELGMDIALYCAEKYGRDAWSSCANNNAWKWRCNAP